MQDLAPESWLRRRKRRSTKFLRMFWIADIKDFLSLRVCRLYKCQFSATQGLFRTLFSLKFRMVYSKFEGSDVKIQTSEAECPCIAIGKRFFFAISLSTTRGTRALSERPLTSHVGKVATQKFHQIRFKTPCQQLFCKTLPTSSWRLVLLVFQVFKKCE